MRSEMNMTDETTTIQVRKTTRDKIAKRGSKLESFDTTLNKILDAIDQDDMTIIDPDYYYKRSRKEVMDK